MPPIFLFMRINISTILIIALAIAVICLSTCNGCLRKKLANCQGSEKVITKTDTIYIHEEATFVDHAPIPYKVDNEKIIVKRVFDTLYLERLAEVDTVYIDTLVKNFYATNYYSHKFNHKYGTITTHDTVYNNRLTGNGLDIDLSLPVVTKTVTVSKSKSAFYVGIDAYGNKNELLTGAGASLEYSSPHALNYSFGTYFTSQQSLNFRASILFPLTKK